MNEAESRPRAEDTPEVATPEEEPSEIRVLRCEVEEWQAKADEWLDKYRRSVAEFSNYRKRQQRDQEEHFLRTSMEVLRRLLPALDDFERAIENMPKTVADTEWAEGLALIWRKLGAILEEFQVVPIEALGKPFDPSFHSALMQVESDEYPSGTVMEELRRGYLIADRVLRATVVKVSAGPRPQDVEVSQQEECGGTE